jgi:hypothetical protein
MDMDLYDGLSLGDGVKAELLPEKPAAPLQTREPEPESDSSTRSEDEAFLQSFLPSDENCEAENTKERTPSPVEVLRNSEWRISKGRKGSVPDRLRTGGEAPVDSKALGKGEKPGAKVGKTAPSMAKTEEKPAAKATSDEKPKAPEKPGRAATTDEKTKASSSSSAATAEIPTKSAESKPTEKTAEYPWKRGNAVRRRDVVVEDTPQVVELPELESSAESSDNFDALPVGELVGWLESHAPKDFLTDQLRLICAEVTSLQET